MSRGGKGKEKVPDLEQGQTRDAAAKKFNVNPRYVSDAKAIKKASWTFLTYDNL